MAERRMFAKTIIDSDAFLDMPASSQNLYFHLGMRADDDGFINNPKKIVRMIGASDDDLRVLLGKRFLLAFEDGVIVIKHWRINNWIRSDRKHETIYNDHLLELEVKPDGSYTECQPTDNQLTTKCHTEYSIGKDSIGYKEEDNKLSKKKNLFHPPTLDEVKEYCIERNNNVDYEKWFNFYESKGWMVGKNKMKDWKAAVRTWERTTTNPDKTLEDYWARVKRGETDGF